jgi:mono/diheme cytochrome c family protein
MERASPMSKFRLSSLLVLLTVAACGKSTVSGTPLATANPEAKAVFESLCFTCHGSTGHGDGPGAAALQPKPRSFADVAWQDSVTDAHIKKVVVYGGAPAGKSPIMPAHPQLKGKNDVLDGLVEIVRGFKGKPRT